MIIMVDNKRQMNPPVMSNTVLDQMSRAMRRYDPHFRTWAYRQVADYPVASENELLVHYLRGGAGPFIDIKLYVELGVGWTLKPVGFEDEEDGQDAKKIVDTKFKEMDFHGTMMELDMFYRVLGRACLVKTYDLNGDFYYNKNEKVTGADSINPMTLTDTSLRNVMADRAGIMPYVQQVTGTDGRSGTVSLEQDRVIYITNNPFAKHSTYGNSDLNNSITDLRTLSRFPHYRDDLARLYSQMHRIVKIDSEKITANEYGQRLKEDPEEAQKYLDDTAEFYRKQEKEGGTIVVFDWEEVIQSSWAGKEVKLADLERQTLESVAYKQKVPLPLLLFAQYVNRDTLETLNDVFVNVMNNGVRDRVFTPIIESTSQEILDQNEITNGHLEVQYNPFLSKDLLKISQIIGNIWPTGSISRPDIREWLGMIMQPNMGGDAWEEMEPMPTSQPISSTPLVAEKKVDPNLVKSVNQYLEKRGLVKFF